MKAGRRIITVKESHFTFFVKFKNDPDGEVFITTPSEDGESYMRAYRASDGSYVASGYFSNDMPRIIGVVVDEEPLINNNIIIFSDPLRPYYRYVIAWLNDPSGYVYAGLETARVYDAEVKAYYVPYDPGTDDDSFWDAPDESRALLWDASEYDQENPLQTNLYGCYAWDVPEGWWKVEVSKDGYETAQSGWMAVLPPQLDVNIDLQTTMAPEIRSAVFSDEGIELSFLHPMKPESLKNIALTDDSGADASYTLVCNEEEAPNGTILTQSVTLRLDEARSAVYNVTAPDAENYSGIKGAVSAVVRNPILGDANGDGEVDIIDVSVIQRSLVYLPVDLYYEDSADIDGDGSATVADAVLLQRWNVQLTSDNRIGKTFTV